MYTKYDFVFYLNLRFWQVLDERDSSEYVIQYSFSDAKYDVEWKEHLLLKIANIEAFSSNRPYATKYSPVKDLYCKQNFSSFILKCVIWLSKNSFVKVKINPDIILSEIGSDNGAVKRWVGYFLKSFPGSYSTYKYFFFLEDLNLIMNSPRIWLLTLFHIKRISYSLNHKI